MAPSFLDADDKNIFAKHEQLPRNWKESKFGFHNFQATQRTGTGAKEGHRNEETVRSRVAIKGRRTIQPGEAVNLIIVSEESLCRKLLLPP